jgi:hypothetical protein
MTPIEEALRSAAGSAAAQRITWKSATWRSSLESSDLDRSILRRAASVIDLLEERSLAEGGVSRAAVRQASTDGFNTLIASQIWGFGSVGYGPSRVVKMLRTPDVVARSEAIRSAAADGAAAGFSALYRPTNRISQLGTAMGTKVLYFSFPEGLTRVVQPLVYDQNVYRALCSLGLVVADPYGRRVDTLPNPSKYMTGLWYEAVCAAIAQAGERAGVSAEDAEAALFELGKQPDE